MTYARIGRRAFRLAAAACMTGLGLSPTGAFAEMKNSLTPGDFVMIVRDYDDNIDAFTDNAAKGEGDACFQITSVEPDGAHMTLISGLYHPWWSDDVIPPGTADVWSNSLGFLENRPSAAPLEQIRQIFATVDHCPAQ